MGKKAKSTKSSKVANISMSACRQQHSIKCFEAVGWMTDRAFCQ